MTHRARVLLLVSPTAIAVGLGLLLGPTGCTPAAIAGLFGLATAAAPVAASAIDALAAQQQRAATLAPGATSADIAAIVARLDRLDACEATVHAVTAPDAGVTDAQRIEAALLDSAAATRGLVDAIAMARKDGGT